MCQRGVAKATDLPDPLGVKPQSQPLGLSDLPPFLHASNLQPYIPPQLRVASSPILFKVSDTPDEPIAYGYRAELLPEVCNVYLKARAAGDLHPCQEHIAARAELLVRALATVGIIALVDEATDYQNVRGKRALATILEKFVAKELQPWIKTFPDEFYDQLFRLKGWGAPRGRNYPREVGRLTNQIVYERLAPSVLEELRRLNPLQLNGTRRHKHHQHLTPDHGHPKLREHLAGVMALMRSASSWGGFWHNLHLAYPVLNKQLAMDSDEFR